LNHFLVFSNEDAGALSHPASRLLGKKSSSMCGAGRKKLQQWCWEFQQGAGSSSKVLGVPAVSVLGNKVPAVQVLEGKSSSSGAGSSSSGAGSSSRGAGSSSRGAGKKKFQQLRCWEKKFQQLRCWKKKVPAVEVLEEKSSSTKKKCS